MKRLLALSAVFAMVLALMAPSTATAQDDIDRMTERAVPEHVLDMKLDQPVTISDGLDASLLGATGDQTVIVRLVGDSVAESAAATPAARKAHKRAVQAEQSGFMSRAAQIAPDAKLLADTQTVLNAVFLEVDAGQLEALAADPGVLRISRVIDYELDLSETVPYIGASAVQADGYDGSGVSVAVLDSGVDYYHENLGGAGAAAYAADDQNIIEPGTFPTAKVVGGYDFVGDLWPLGPELPDPDPLDKPTFGDGHGTHVADIIAGQDGVAPGADVVAVKVCSSVSSSCSGIALIQGMDFAVDPDGDGDPADAVDIINMSLGSTYGQAFDDDLSQAVENAAALGVLTVASAGNSADKPFVTGTPSATAAALSVAQTQVPSASLQLISVSGADYPAVFQAWSLPLTSALSGPVQYGDGAGGGLNGCSTGPDPNAPSGFSPFPAGSLAGKVVLVDRGTCFFSTKIQNIEAGGGIAGIIGLVAPGAPFAGGFGAGTPPTIPGYMISQADSNAIKASIPATATLDPANQLPLIGQMVGSSSRGPAMLSHIVKPEIGAPGASVSAIAGTGTGTSAFGGTSGAAPMVSGSAALLLQAEPGLSPAEAKARLVNTGDTNIDTDPFTGLAPITRIGGGEVRVDAAVATPLAAWDDDTLLPTLSFGHVDVAHDQVKLKRTLRIQNYSDSQMTISVAPTFRYAADADSGAVSVKISPSDVSIAAGASRTVLVDMTITGANLPGNAMNSGSQGANPAALNANEFDGYVVLEAGDGTSIHVPWHVLPRQAADVQTAPDSLLVFESSVAQLELHNNGVGTAQNDAYALLAVSPDQPEGGPGAQSPTPDIRAVGVNTFPVPAFFCSAEQSFIWAFAVNTWERQSHLLPVSHQIWLDTNQDGSSDYVVLNRDLTFSGVGDGRQVTWAFDLATGNASAFFFTEHSTVTGNTVMYICGEQVGLTGTDMLATNVDAFVVAQDFYFGGPGDFVGGLTITPLGEQYVGLPVDVPGNDHGTMQVLDFGPFPGNSAELGVLLVTNGDRGGGFRGGAVADSEAIVLVTQASAGYVRTIIGN